MRETERVRIMGRMMKRKVRERRRMMGKTNVRRRVRDMTEKMVFVALNPLYMTIFHLLLSFHVSMDARSREFLIFAALGVNEALQLVKSLEKLRGRIEDERMEALEGEISEAALKLENVLDSHVSDLFLSQYESESIQLTGDERQPLVFSLNLQEIEQDIDGFIQFVMKMEKLLNPWLQEEEEDGDGKELNVFELSNQSEVDVITTLFMSLFPEEEEDSDDEGDVGGKDSDILGLSDRSEVDVSRSYFISWFATKAASIFLGKKEEYIQDLENMLPLEEEKVGAYIVLFDAGTTSDYSRMVREVRKHNDNLMIWWINKAAASIFLMERDYTQRLVNPLPDSASIVSSGTESGVNMVGSTDLFCEIRDDLLEDSGRLRIGTIVGMAGIGKTALAKKIIKDPLISSKFEYCILVTMGPEYQWREILQAILAQMSDDDKMLMEEDASLVYSLRETLTDRKCLIVFDDIWSQELYDIFEVFPWEGSQSVILFTTRINDAPRSVYAFYHVSVYKVPFLNNEESWNLLRTKIFGEKRCPHGLEKVGKKIAENCEGLPLLILTVAGLLSKAEKTLEFWTEVAANKTNSIFVDAYEQVSDVVYPSYYYLPQHLKACFLYLGAFPQNDEFRVSRLINLWSADGFLGVPYTVLNTHAYELLRDILSNNVALGTQWSTCDHHRVKALSLHSVFWYLCKREAREEKFLHVLNSYTDASVQGIKSQRRLSIYKNSILSIKEARDSIASISALRSLLCTGTYHQYEVPISMGLRLLKVLDALTIRFYEFPIEVVKLVQLRYLALTCNGNLPPSISNLWGLHCLILNEHHRIKSSSVSHTYLPVEIWDLQELEHLHIMGRNLPDPPHGAVLQNLSTLLDVGAHSCTERVLASIPYLEKLRVQIELMPVDSEPLRFCDDISHLQSLVSLQFVVVNPELMFEIVAPPALGSLSYLSKLTLSGCGYPWKGMNKIAELSNLKVLKLKCYAFRGEKWQVKEGEFKSLVYLSIEDTDLVHWTGYFEHLYKLTIKNCYRLLELPEISYLREIRVVDCNPSAVTCAKQMESRDCSLYINCSWLAG